MAGIGIYFFTPQPQKCVFFFFSLIQRLRVIFLLHHNLKSVFFYGFSLLERLFVIFFLHHNLKSVFFSGFSLLPWLRLITFYTKTSNVFFSGFSLLQRLRVINLVLSATPLAASRLLREGGGGVGVERVLVSGQKMPNFPYSPVCFQCKSLPAVILGPLDHFMQWTRSANRTVRKSLWPIRNIWNNCFHFQSRH